MSAALPLPNHRLSPTGRHHLALLLPLHPAVDGGESQSALQGGDLEGTTAAGRGCVPASPQTHATVLTALPLALALQGSRELWELPLPHVQRLGQDLLCCTSPSHPQPYRALSRARSGCAVTLSPPCRFYLIAGGIPLIICGITAAVNIHNYHDNNP